MIGNILPRTGEKKVLVMVLVLAMLLIGLFPPMEYVRDSLGWALAVEQQRSDMLHPHHLVYMPINWLILKFLSLFCAHCTAMTAGQIHGAIWTAILVATATMLGRSITGSIWIGALFALLLVVSKSIWVLLMQPQSYAASYALMILLTTLIFAFRNRQDNWSGVALITACYAASVLYHESMVLLGLPMAYYLVATRKNGWLSAAVVVGGAGAVVLTLYVWAVYIAYGTVSIAAFWEYITRFGQVMSDPNYFNVSNLTIERLGVLLNSVMDALFVAPWQTRMVFLGALIILGAVVLTWSLVQIFRHDRFSHERIFLLMAAGIFSLLCFWGSPGDYAWPVFIVIPFAILMLYMMADYIEYKPTGSGAENALVLLMAIVASMLLVRNLVTTIVPMSSDRGRDYAYAKSIAQAVPNDCIVFEINMHVYYNLNYYFNRAAPDFWDMVTAFYYADPAIINKGIVSDEDRSSHCVAVDSRYIEPGANVSGNTGFDRPVQWNKMIDWLFDLQKSPSGGVSWRSFSSVDSANGRRYLLIKHDSRENAPLKDDMYYRIMQTSGGHDPTIMANYQKWRALHTFE